MINTQEWLNGKYKNEEVTDLHINERGLEGELDLTGFTKLEKVYISHFYVGENDEVKLEIKDKKKYENKIVKLKDAQNLLNKEDKEKEVINLTEILYDESNSKFKYTEKDELKIEGFENLKEIKIDKVGNDYIEFAKINKITIANCPQLKKVDINTFVDNKDLEIINCPELTELDCSWNQLENLDLNGLVNDGQDNNKLEKLDCNSNQLTKLDVSKCSNLTELYSHNNRLTDITLPNETKNLKVLALLNNDFRSTGFNKNKDLSFLKDYTNLERLYLGNFTNHENSFFKHCDETKDKTETYNRFDGSLENLKGLKNLQVLDISNTDISSVNQYYFWGSINDFPSLEEIYCSSKERPGSKVENIEKELKKENSGFYFPNSRFIKKHKSQEWLDENYPEGGCKNKYDLENKDKKRESITKLDIKEWGLTGNLDLSDFVDLEELDCSNNQLKSLNLEKNTKLTKICCSGNKLEKIDLKSNRGLKEIYCQDNQLDSIDLSDYHRLTHLNVNNNKLTNADFLDALYYKYKWYLKVLKIGNNSYKKIPVERQQSRKGSVVKNEALDFLKPFTGLTELDISNCPFEGNLKPLEDMKDLKVVNISNTDIDGGLEYLLDSCQLVCVYDSKSLKKSNKISEALKKYCVDRQDNGYYNLKKWREDIESLLEHSGDIQKDIKKFFNEWRGEVLSELKSLEELEKYRNQFEKVKWVNRVVSISGGALSLTGYPETGGWIGVIGPLAEAYISHKEEEMCGTHERKWEEFMKSMKKFWNHYRELMDVLGPIEFCSEDSTIESKEIKPLWEIIKKVSNEESSKDNFAWDLKENWDNIQLGISRKKQWNRIAEYIIEINEKGKMTKTEKDDEIINKGKATNDNQSELQAIIVENRGYGSINR